jgi:hypothetical protein
MSDRLGGAAAGRNQGGSISARQVRAAGAGRGRACRTQGAGGDRSRLVVAGAALAAALIVAGGPGAGPGWPAAAPPVAAGETPPAAPPAASAVDAAAELALAAGRARLSRAEVPAAGRQEAILTVDRFGRYSLRAASRQGSAVRVVDRMAGELGAAGEAAHENGRLDLFLDRGEYKVVVESHEHGEGTAKLTVAPFVDARTARGGATPQLVERKILQDDLDDLRQISWWLRLAARREVRLLAAGRNLADLRLWRDGSWLEGVEPSCAAVQPVTGRPLLRCEIAATLPAGLYLVTASGGPSQPWSEEAAEHPVYLRWGYPRLADADRRRYQVSPFGEDRFELPDNVNYVRIELPQAAPAQLTAGWRQPGQLLSALAGEGAATAEVKKESVPPVAAVRVPAKPAVSAPSAAPGARRSTGRAAAAPGGRRSAGRAAAARAAEPSIDDDEGERDEESGAAAGTPATPPGASGGAGAEAEAAPEDAAGVATSEESGAAEIEPPAAAGGGEEMAGERVPAGEAAGEAAAGEAAAGAPAPVQPAQEEEPAAAAAGGEPAATNAAAPETSEVPESSATPATAESDEGPGGQDAGAGGAGAGGAAAGGAAAAATVGPRLWVTVRGTPGQAYVLQHFEQRTSYTLHEKGRYWISTVHSGDPRDSVDATAVLTSHPEDSGERERLERSAAVPIDGQHAWARRFNLLGRLELFLEVKEKGTYEVVAAGGGRFRIEPFVTSRPARYKAPDFAPGRSRWDLDPGLYVLTGVPLRRGGMVGIITLGVRPAGKFSALLREAAAPPGGGGGGGGSDDGERDPVRGSARLAPTDLDPSRRYTLWLNRQPGVEAGVALRPWPVDLSQPLPVTQRPGEPLAIDFTVAAAGTLRAETEDGQLIEAAVDGGPWQTATAVGAGDHQVQLRNPGEAATARTVSYSLWVEPRELAAAAPLPPLPAAALAALPRFPVLRPGSPRYVDLARGASATFLVQADQPALYQLQTTGVLATGAALRTRTVVSLAAGSANGVGRNALVRQYLRQGDFQATVTAVGLSQGHLGVELRTTPLVDGGELRLGAPARITLGAGQGVAYRFTIAQQGDYRLLAMGLGFVYTCRLEDADGWPITTPNLAADISRALAPGTYRLVLLPQAIGGRAVTLLTRRREKLRFDGHGPHALPLDTAVEHLWREPDQPPASTADPQAAATDERRAERPPDLWRFELPAAATTTITLDEEMEGTLTRLDAPGGTAELGRVPPGRQLSLELGAGRYQLAAVCSRRNNLVRYHVRVATLELVDGEEPLLTAPVTLPVSVGGAGVVEISSYSASDVRARLYAADGRLVADEDDRPDDWNFLISERLPAGRYRLEIEPVGRRRAKLRVAMRTAAETEERPLALPYRGDFELGGAVHLLPLSLPRQSNLLLVAARSQENLGLGIEVREGSGWRLVGSRTGREPRLELPLGGPNAGGAAADGTAGPYRVRLWSLERRGTPVRLAAAAVNVPPLCEGQLARGAALPPVAGLEPPLGPLAAAVVELSRPGLVRLQLGGGRGGGGNAGGAGSNGGDGESGGGTGTGTGTGWRGGSIAGQVLAPLPEVDAVLLGGLRESGGRVWLVAEAPPHGAPRLHGERLALAAGLEHAVAFHLPAPAAAVSCDLDRGRRPAGPVLAMVTALAGQPAVRVEEAAAMSAGAAEAGGAAEAAGAGQETAVPSAGTAGAAATLAIGPRSAVSVALSPRQPAARVWSGDPAPAGGSLQVRLAQLSFVAPRREPAAWGVTGGSISGYEARQFELPAGAKKVRLSLGAALVAVLSDGDAAASTHWHGGLPFEELLDGGATRLTLLHTREVADPFTFELLPRVGGEGELALPPATPFIRSFDRAGTLRLRLPGEGAGTTPATPATPATPGGAAAAGRYHVWSDAGTVQATLLDGAGGVRRGTEVAGAPGGFLLLEHGAGIVAAWTAGLLEPGGETAAGAGWQAPLAAPTQEVKPPATVPLAGRFAHLTVAIREPAVLHVRAASPALTLLARPAAAGATTAGGTPGAGPAGSPGAGIETVAIHPTGVRLDAWLPPGLAHLGFGALGDGELAGFAELTTTPVIPVGEGRGPEILLPAGDTRYFSFHVADRRPVGWGAAAGAEHVTCRLLSADGRAVVPRAPGAARSAAVPGEAAAPAAAAPAGTPGGGQVEATSPATPADMLQMAELEAGDYLLALTSPPDAAPVRVRPVVVGLELPDTGPPPEVIRQYLRDAGAVVPDAASGSHP